MATLRQVAQLANVSPATASRVLGRSPNALRVSEKTTQRVRDAAEQLGYRVNYHMQAVATGRTLTTGFITSTKVHHHLSFGAGDLYFEALRRGVDYSLQEEGSTLLSVRPNPQFSALAQAVHYIAEKRLDALIVPSYDGIVDHLNQTPEDLPVVVVNHAEEINRTQVSFNSEKAIQQIVQHLKALEHRTVLWFGPIATDKNSTPAQRQQCFVESTREAGLKSILCLAKSDDPRITCVDGKKLMLQAQNAMSEQLKQSDRPWTAVVAYNDQWAISACRALQAIGLNVPGDVSVVGFDNLLAEFCIPRLTSIDHQLHEMGQRAGTLATQWPNANKAQRLALRDHHEVIDPVLVVRESTGPAAT